MLGKSSSSGKIYVIKMFLGREKRPYKFFVASVESLG